MLSFSTCWCSRRHDDGEAMLQEIHDLGFEYCELSHGIKLHLLPGIMSGVEKGIIKVSSVHNYFPAPLDDLGDAPDMCPFTSYKPEVRERAIKLTVKSIEQGARLGARYIVLHMGTVETLVRAGLTNKLQRLARSGSVGTKEYADAKGEWVRKRAERAALYIQRAREAIDALLPVARENKVKLGVEGRSHYEQVPSEEEVYELMQLYKDEPMVGYWHDTGHIQRKHNLLLLNHEQFIRKMAPFMIGGHMNDVRWPSRNHRVPLMIGETGVDFDTLVPMFPHHIPLVWELASSNKAEDIRYYREQWEQRFPWTLEDVL